MFHRKNRRFFGNDIAPKCEYCANSAGSGEELQCSAGLTAGSAESCARFRYDPLRRAPADSPEIRKPQPEDFKL